MKNTIPFNLFGEEKELCFKIKDIRELERKLGKPIQLIYSNAVIGVDFCFAAYPILLKISEKEFEEKLEKYLEDGTGSIDKLATPALNALTITGVIGKPLADAIRKLYYPTEAVQNGDEKNVEATVN
ncbi:MAG: hypothetical protein ABFC57_12970 [Veillonellales bacterium]